MAEGAPFAARECGIKTEFIELNKLLKLENIASSGGEAKLMIQEGMVTVDGEAESRVRRKLTPGCVVQCRGETVKIVKG